MNSDLYYATRVRNFVCTKRSKFCIRCEILTIRVLSCKCIVLEGKFNGNPPNPSDSVNFETYKSADTTEKQKENNQGRNWKKHWNLHNAIKLPSVRIEETDKY